MGLITKLKWLVGIGLRDLGNEVWTLDYDNQNPNHLLMLLVLTELNFQMF